MRQAALFLPASSKAISTWKASISCPNTIARAFLSHGTTTVITDLHEVANAGGLAGVRWYLSLMDKVPLDLFVMAPSCVPSSKYELGAGRFGVKSSRA